MTKIWGLDLKEMRWGKFKSSYMWNNTYHLRRTKFIVYQCAMIFCVVSESLGTATLSDYLDQQKFVHAKDPRATIHNHDFIGAFSCNIFAGIFVAFIFGSAFFFDLFWPERTESRGVKLAWRACSVLATIFTLASALLITVILATHRAAITGVSGAQARALLHSTKPDLPLVYKHNKRGIASVVFMWAGFVSTAASTILLWHSLAHIDAHGPFSSHARAADGDKDTTADIEKPPTPAGAGSNPTASPAAAGQLDGTSDPVAPQQATAAEFAR